ncbi:ABC transporter ATP-binding protein [Gallibacterium salpingitidis]|uniref:ABC transporter domain-containing protein n=1 Tax=Gallibacterium salpingitidis TaxID=505341 RepID=A0A1A7NY49_9PAST|nr:sn-glycerol-3-phosphate ABC transporter ATP-binding protein UgpC [Gallibacterium salpingitidis]OBW94638.1 hypothetical protein QS62_05905 [Gallibacterium salpingitidis]
MSSLHIHHVSKVYPNGKKAISDANVEINSGEFVVFVGPSGCGKSTLLRMIAGLESISEGDILLEETRINDTEPADRNIAMVFQNYALYPHMTVYKNLAYGLINRKVSKEEIKKRVNAAAEMLQLSEYLNNKPHELSGGQRQRVAMGRAIVREPKLFLFDEPLSNLDAKLRNVMRMEIKALQRRLKTTSIYVTHDQVEAMTMADKIVIINAGQIEQVGTPDEIYNNPRNLFVATFMGSPAMNILQANIHGHQLFLAENASITTNFQLERYYNDDMYKQHNTYKRIYLGVRPESISLTTEAVADHPLQIPVWVEAVEDLGPHLIAHCLIGNQKLLVLSRNKNIRDGSHAFAQFEHHSLYLFDQNNELNITSQLQQI